MIKDKLTKSVVKLEILIKKNENKCPVKNTIPKSLSPKFENIFAFFEVITDSQFDSWFEFEPQNAEENDDLMPNSCFKASIAKYNPTKFKRNNINFLR